MSVIANLDVNIRGNTSGIEKAAQQTTGKLSQVKKAVDAHASSVESRFGGMKDKIGHALSHIPGGHIVGGILAPLVGFAGKIGSAFMSAVPGIMGATTAMGSLGTATTIATGGLNLILAGVAAGGAAAAAAGLAWFGMGHHASEGIDNLAKSADRLGMSTQELAGWRHAADLAGVDADLLDASFTKLLKNLSEGGPKTGESLATIGLSVKELDGLSLSDIGMKLAGAFEKIEDQGVATAAAMDLMGKSGAKMLNLLQSGNEEVQRSMKEAEEIGLAVTRQQAAEVEAANDAADTMKSSFTGLMRTAAITIAPFVKMVADGITDAMKWVNSFRDTLLNFSYTVVFVWQNFGDYASLAFDLVLYRATKLINQIAHLFSEVLPAVFKAAWDAAADVISGEDIEKAIAKALLRVRQSLDYRVEGGIERSLREKYEAASRAIEARRKAFVAGKPAPIKPKQGGEEPGTVAEGKHDHAAVERGSQEAFKIIAGQQGDKMLKAFNEQVAEARKTNKLLDKLLNKQPPAAVRKGSL